jgi:hypothetical protein
MVKMKELLLNPDYFFSEKSKEKVNLKIPFIIVLINGIFTAAPSILLMNKVTAALPGQSSFAIVGVVLAAISCLIGVFIGWLALSALFYIISTLFYSQGSFRRTFEFIGYGFTPTILGSFVAILCIYSLVSSIGIQAQDPQLLQQSMAQIMMNNPFVKIAQIIGILCTLWSANIWIFAILHARNLSTRNAFLTIGFPVGLYVIYSSFNFLVH